jgi:hypothetical protein
MTYENVTLSLPSGLVGTLHAMALERDAALDDLVRGMLDREAMRLRSARTSVEARDLRVARMRNLLAPDMTRATGWADLQARLALYGLALKSSARELILHDLITEEPMCTSAALGFGGAELAGRFGGALADAGDLGAGGLAKTA